MEKNMKKNVCVYTYIYILKKPNHFAVHLKLTQYCKSTILQLKTKLKKKKIRKSTHVGTFKLPVIYLIVVEMSLKFSKMTNLGITE